MSGTVPGFGIASIIVLNQVITPAKKTPEVGYEYRGSIAFHPYTKTTMWDKFRAQGMTVLDDDFMDMTVYENKDRTIAGSVWPDQDYDGRPADRITIQMRENFDTPPLSMHDLDNAFMLTTEGHQPGHDALEFPNSQKGTISTFDFQRKHDNSATIDHHLESHLPIDEIPVEQLNVEKHFGNLPDSVKSKLFPNMGELWKQSPSDLVNKGWTVGEESAYFEYGNLGQGISWSKADHGTFKPTQAWFFNSNKDPKALNQNNVNIELKTFGTGPSLVKVEAKE